ncbi:YafY family transcriptional regulator [Listeria monocytogenes]|uniref:YafY family transcriptional regulator n=1 Tax=Listeria monocytogenes TaxID=1639 RepID=A0A7U7YJB4_LISMN|nr:YafY family protein [Listeria monocytogenes]MDA19155.1 YafY family transcriptional regulator [Listeria monocytogenes serotype 4a]EAC4810703.1 YafY family transcriptional regulator [Listeria monocytogenes]EAC7280917.1 YafY family transcriptional regulator [Listeria monocytogenes]EAC7287156.1 YafY family transcriptional regulator [Listeria monocytogenes]EAC7299005.1 YafY family transcriptional regulator [Listeria monocytogenes]
MKVDRLMSIVLILLDKERISAQELADRFEVSLRTIYRDIDAIDLAGVPIRSTPGVGGGFEIMPNYKMDSKVFSTADLSAILMGLSSLSNMVRGDELINALAKIKSFIPADRAKEIELKANQIYIDLSQWTGNNNIQPHVEIIKVALQENKLLTFEYIAHQGNKTVRIVEPYQLVMKSSHWYLYGYCQNRNDFRLFRLSRMSGLKILEETFTLRNFRKPQLEMEDIVAVMQIEIKIRIHQSIIDRVLDYCSYENFYPDGEEHYIVSFPFIENEYHYDILLSFGDKCECLEPLHIREKMKRRIYDIVSIYEN